MNWLPSRRHTPIGLDLSGCAIRAVQLKRTGGGYSRYAAVTIHRTNPDAPVDRSEAASIRRILDRHGFVGDNVVLAVPRDQLLTTEIEVVANADAAWVDETARRTFAGLLKCDLRDLEVSAWDVPATGRPTDARHVTAVACAHDDSHALLDTFEAEGFVVRALDTEAHALLRAGTTCRHAPGQRAILAIDWHGSLLVAATDSGVMYHRTIPCAGVSGIYQSLTELLQLDLADVVDLVRDSFREDETNPPASARLTSEVAAVVDAAAASIVSELRASLVYAARFFHDSQIADLVLTGDGAALPGLDRQLSATLDVAVTPFSAPELTALSNSTPSAVGGSDLAVALGLAKYVE